MPFPVDLPDSALNLDQLHEQGLYLQHLGHLRVVHAAFSSLGGIGLTAAIGPKRLGQWRIASDFIGGTAGSFAGMAVGDNLMRAKDSLAGGKGQTPFERLSEKEREIYEQNLLAQYGLGGYNLTQYDPFFQANGLG